jgi:CubicO group peptidase (beta-lactamase class C family)
MEVACSARFQQDALPAADFGSPVRPSRRIALAFLLFSVSAALVYASWSLTRLVPIGTAYAAKTLCSGVFLSGRPARSVIEEDILADNHPLLRLVTPSLDAQRRRASATFLGAAERVAQFRPGFGCTLALGVEPDALAGTGRSLQPRLLPSDPLPVGPAPPGIEHRRLDAAMAAAFADPRARTRVVAVVYDGHLIAERYAAGFSARTPMPGWSMTKTAVAVLTGMLLKQGSLRLDQSSLLDEWSAPGDARATITIDHLLRMTDGLAFDEKPGDLLSDVVLMLLTTGDSSGFAAARPLRTAPGLTWRYANGTTNALVRALRRAAAMPPERFAQWPREALFTPLGMRSATIELDAAGMPVGSSFMHASPHDWLRFGQFLLQDGTWQGQRLVPPEWIAYMRSVTPQSPGREFGAHLWLRVPEPYNSRARNPPALPEDAFHLVGHEGQLLSVIPSRKLVVLRMGLTRERFAWDHEAFLARVLEALGPA